MSTFLTPQRYLSNSDGVKRGKSSTGNTADRPKVGQKIQESTIFNVFIEVTVMTFVQGADLKLTFMQAAVNNFCDVIADISGIDFFGPSVFNQLNLRAIAQIRGEAQVLKFIHVFDVHTGTSADKRQKKRTNISVIRSMIVQKNRYLHPDLSFFSNAAWTRLRWVSARESSSVSIFLLTGRPVNGFHTVLGKSRPI
jgi:hypothetical protein